METKDITANNALILEFMGVKPKDIGTHWSWSDGVNFSVMELSRNKVLQAMAEYAKYHQNWNWLMPVVEKIESYLADDCNVEIGFNMCSICVIVGNYFEGYTENDGFDILAHGSTRIEAVYNAVLEFILWYNQNK